MPQLSVTIHVTLVIPTGNSYVAGSTIVLPTLAKIETSLQLSFILGEPRFAVVVQSPKSSKLDVVVTSVGHIIVGGVLSGKIL